MRSIVLGARCKGCEGSDVLMSVTRSELSRRYVKAMLHLSAFSGTKKVRRAEKEKPQIFGRRSVLVHGGI